MTPKFDRYAGLQAAKTKNIDKFSPAEWATYFSKMWSIIAPVAL